MIFTATPPNGGVLTEYSVETQDFVDVSRL